MPHEPKLTFVKNVSEKVFSDKCALLKIPVPVDRRHIQKLGAQKYHLAASALRAFCTAFDLREDFMAVPPAIHKF